MKLNHNREEPHVVMIPSPGIGHLNPMIELARTLLSRHSLTLSFFTISGHVPFSAIANLSEQYPNDINCIPLPPVDTSDLSPDAKVLTVISVIMRRSVEPFRKFLPNIQPATAFILDIFCTDLLDVAAEIGIPAYILFTSNATALSLFLYMPILHEEMSGEYKDLDLVKIPGCIPFRGTDLVDPMLDRQDTEYSWCLHHCRRYREATGIMINTIEELEPIAIGALRQGRDYGDNMPPVYPVGPLVKIDDESDDKDMSREDCLKWLDEQPRGSVLFVCLGSGGTLTQVQLTELAWGLEMSGHRFLWVARKPYNIGTGAFFGTGGSKEMEVTSFLPEGFVKRTAEVGMVVPEWAPQVKVLSHEAVAGFLSHCGWNSTLESITNGVPMIAWPLYAEQRMNSRLLVEEIGVAVGVSDEERLVLREEVAQAVKLLMDGEMGMELRKRAGELSKVVRKTLAWKGSSHQRIAQLVNSWSKEKLVNGLESSCMSVST